MSEELHSAGTTRREVLTRAAYVAPIILTLTAVPSFASAGSSSGRDERDGRDDGKRRGRDWHDGRKGGKDERRRKGRHGDD
jgi:hypothetical protein